MTEGRAFTLAELRTVTPVSLKRRPRAAGPSLYDHVKAAHLAMLKECGLPLDTPMPLVYVRPGRP